MSNVNYRIKLLKKFAAARVVSEVIDGYQYNFLVQENPNVSGRQEMVTAVDNGRRAWINVNPFPLKDTNKLRAAALISKTEFEKSKSQPAAQKPAAAAPAQKPAAAAPAQKPTAAAPKPSATEPTYNIQTGYEKNDQAEQQVNAAKAFLKQLVEALSNSPQSIPEQSKQAFENFKYTVDYVQKLDPLFTGYVEIGQALTSVSTTLGSLGLNLPTNSQFYQYLVNAMNYINGIGLELSKVKDVPIGGTTPVAAAPATPGAPAAKPAQKPKTVGGFTAIEQKQQNLLNKYFEAMKKQNANFQFKFKYPLLIDGKLGPETRKAMDQLKSLSNNPNMTDEELLGWVDKLEQYFP